EQLTPNIGAEVRGIKIGDDLSDANIQAVRHLLLKHKLLVFRNQKITAQQHVNFAARFGELEIHPVFPNHPEFPELVLLGGDSKTPARENLFHSDVSWRDTPSMGSILRCVE